MSLNYIDIRQSTPEEGAGYRSGDRVEWRGHRFEIVDVAGLAPGYFQVLLQELDRKSLPISIPASDLADAVFVS